MKTIHVLVRMQEIFGITDKQEYLSNKLAARDTWKPEDYAATGVLAYQMQKYGLAWLLFKLGTALPGQVIPVTCWRCLQLIEGELGDRLEGEVKAISEVYPELATDVVSLLSGV